MKSDSDRIDQRFTVPQPDPEKASEIEVLFRETENKTEVIFEHRSFEKHGKNGRSYKEAMRSPKGWPYILDRYRTAAGKRVEH